MAIASRVASIPSGKNKPSPGKRNEGGREGGLIDPWIRLLDLSSGKTQRYSPEDWDIDF